MPAYIFASITSVKDPARFGQYQGQAGATVSQYGGKVLAGGNKIEIADGNWKPAGVVCLEFENIAKAKEWYNSSEYQAVIADRVEATEGGLIFVDAG